MLPSLLADAQEAPVLEEPAMESGYAIQARLAMEMTNLGLMSKETAMREFLKIEDPEKDLELLYREQFATAYAGVMEKWVESVTSR